MIDIDGIRSQEQRKWNEAQMMARLPQLVEWYHLTMGLLLAELEEVRRQGDRPEMDS